MRWIVYLLFSMTILGSLAYAEDRLGVCEKKMLLGGSEQSVVASRALTLEQAEEILGHYNPDTANGGGPGALIRKAIQYLLTHEQNHFEEAANNMEIFLKTVRLLSIMYNPGWGSTRFAGVDGSVGFSGGQGFAVVMSPRGEIYRGTVMILNSRYSGPFVWNADYSHLTKIGTIQFAQALAVSP